MVTEIIRMLWITTVICTIQNFRNQKPWRHSLVICVEVVWDRFLFLDHPPEVKIEQDAQRWNAVHVELERRVIDEHSSGRQAAGQNKQLQHKVAQNKSQPHCVVELLDFRSTEQRRCTLSPWTISPSLVLCQGAGTNCREGIRMFEIKSLIFTFQVPIGVFAAFAWLFMTIVGCITVQLNRASFPVNCVCLKIASFQSRGFRFVFNSMLGVA